MSSYPKWLYHHSKEPELVADEAAHKELGPEWVESPADAKRPEPKPEPKADEKPKPKGK